MRASPLAGPIDNLEDTIGLATCLQAKPIDGLQKSFTVLGLHDVDTPSTQLQRRSLGCWCVLAASESQDRVADVVAAFPSQRSPCLHKFPGQ